MKMLVIGLGNEHISDDGLGIITARQLRPEISSQADVIESSKSGMALIEIFCGYEKVIIIDAIKQNSVPAGTIIEMTPRMLKMIPSPSPRYTGLPEIFERAERLNLAMPQEIRIFAVTATDLFTVGGDISTEVRNAIPELVCRVKQCLRRWEGVACE